MAISTFVSATAMVLALLFTNAHNSPLDELGCHRDPPGGKYHCHTGSLKGKEFGNKEEAERSIASVTPVKGDSDFAVSYEDTPEAAQAKEEKLNSNGLPPPPDGPPKAVINNELLKVVSWNVKKGEKVDYDRIVNVLIEADIVTLQELDLDEKGKGPLHIIGDLVQSRLGEKICRMWFKNSAQGRERVGILWKQSTIGFVNESGEMKDKCGEMAVVIPTNKAKGERMVAASTFYSKTQKKMFQLGTIYLGNRPGNPSREIPSWFKPLETSQWPTIVTGDLKYSGEVKKGWNFKTAIASGNVVSKKGRGTKSTSENIWTRNAVVVRALHINLYDRFSEMKAKEVDSGVSNYFPMLAEIALMPEPDDHLNTVIIKSHKKEAVQQKKETPKAKVVSEAKPLESFEEPLEDIEAEAKTADSETRTPAAAAPKSPPKKKKSKSAKAKP